MGQDKVVMRKIFVNNKPITRMKRQAIHWEKILARQLFNKVFISRIDKELSKLS